MDSRQDLAILISQIRDGSESASTTLVSRYGEHILRIVRHKLDKSLRPKFDSQDFVQAVWASFFALLPERGHFEDSEGLAAFLAQLAQNKVTDEVRQRLERQKHNINRERLLERVEMVRAKALNSRELTPDAIAIAREEWQRFLARQPGYYRRIFEMMNEGHDREDVARELGISEKTVQRVMKRLAPSEADEAR